MKFAEMREVNNDLESIPPEKVTMNSIKKSKSQELFIRNSYQTVAKTYALGMGEAVANRTINRKLDPETRIELPHLPPGEIDNRVFVYETWADVAKRVALGNTDLLRHYRNVPQSVIDKEFHDMHHHLRQASLLMSGRHLQHGDPNQWSRPIEVFTNCSTSAASFLKFLLLLSGSGVGRAYDDLMMLVDWANLPFVIPVIDRSHKDVQSGEIKFYEKKDALHLYRDRPQIIFEVPDSREGWAKAIERMETLAFEKSNRNSALILDFSKVRPRGSPIKGMQGRPASGPAPLMVAIANMARLRDTGSKPWFSTLYADHYLAECVLVGGARRAARMATKTWRDKETVLEFIGIKVGNFLWSANNSVTVDKTFWRYVNKVLPLVEKGNDVDDLIDSCKISDLEGHAFKVFEAVCQHSYHDGTGEPGFINQHKLTFNPKDIKQYQKGEFASSNRYTPDKDTLVLTKALAKAFVKSPWKTIVNPCGEIVLIMIGGYCVIADNVPYHARPLSYPKGKYHKLSAQELKQWDDDAIDSFGVSARTLIRTNLMEALYSKEVARTNRIGVSITGLHEYAWTRFEYGWKDLVNEQKSLDFWLMLSTFKRAVQNEAKRYSEELGVETPHTDTCLKPAGTTSKLFMLTEAAHLAAMREFLRWVQFRSDSPQVEEYRKKGFPVKELVTYGGTTIVGFPTTPEICTLGMGDKLVTAAEATPEEQYQWVRLLEKYWITGVEEDGITPLRESGNQISYTLKYNRAEVSYEEFRKTLLKGQQDIRCCSVMPENDGTAYEYQPEQAVTREEYEAICNAIEASEIAEDVGVEHVDCQNGACPIDFKERAA